MTLAALALNGLLVVLLLAALAFGWRLERRLKALKDSHDGFAKAVADLDAAASRAEQGLADLRAATEEAAETLAGRIETARGLAAKLDRPAASESRAKAFADDDGELLLGSPPSRGQPGPAWSPPRETRQSRARVDDDLFDDGVALRTIVGGRR